MWWAEVVNIIWKRQIFLRRWGCLPYQNFYELPFSLIFIITHGSPIHFLIIVKWKKEMRIRNKIIRHNPFISISALHTYLYFNLSQNRKNRLKYDNKILRNSLTTRKNAQCCCWYGAPTAYKLAVKFHLFRRVLWWVPTKWSAHFFYWRQLLKLWAKSESTKTWESGEERLQYQCKNYIVEYNSFVCIYPFYGIIINNTWSYNRMGRCFKKRMWTQRKRWDDVSDLNSKSGSGTEKVKTSFSFSRKMRICERFVWVMIIFFLRVMWSMKVNIGIKSFKYGVLMSWNYYCDILWSELIWQYNCPTAADTGQSASFF